MTNEYELSLIKLSQLENDNAVLRKQVEELEEDGRQLHDLHDKAQHRISQLEETGKCKLLSACHKQMEWDANHIRELQKDMAEIANMDGETENWGAIGCKCVDIAHAALDQANPIPKGSGEDAVCVKETAELPAVEAAKSIPQVEEKVRDEGPTS